MKIGKETSWVDRLGTFVGDMIRDIGTADQMAKEKFEGDTALMHAARGGVTTLVGVGLEYIVDGVWKKGIKEGKMWFGRTPFEFDDELKNKLKALEANYPRWHYFIENASKDLMSGLANNAISYFSGHMLPQAEAKHLLISTVVNAVESAGTAGLNYEQKPGLLDETVAVGTLEWQTGLRKVAKFSNPATVLGADWILDGFRTLFGNIQKVRSVRKEKGGLPGKKVDMSKQNDRWQRKDRSDQGWKGQDRGNKVYYGKSQWNSPKEEEVDLAKFE